MNQRKRKRLALQTQREQVNRLDLYWATFENATSYRGLDYRIWSAQHVNQHGEFHYGVISVNALHEWVWDSFEPDYGDPHCPKCGNEAVAGDSPIPDEVWDNIDADADADREDASRKELGYKTLHHACGDYACDDCRVLFDGEDAYEDEACGHNLDDGEYVARIDSYFDVFVIRSPYYTYAQYCSPCAPGAGHLENPCPNGVKTYCFDATWFDDDVAPYPIWSCKTDKLIKPKRSK